MSQTYEERSEVPLDCNGARQTASEYEKLVSSRLSPSQDFEAEQIKGLEKYELHVAKIWRTVPEIHSQYEVGQTRHSILFDERLFHAMPMPMMLSLNALLCP